MHKIRWISCALVAAMLTASSGSAATYVVTTTADAGASPLSLRQAITNANNNVNTPDQIVFNIPGTGPFVITPLSPLPTLTDDGCTIDGFSQPGASMGNDPPTAATLQIELDGHLAGSSYGLHIESSFNTIQGLAINNFERSGIAITPPLGVQAEYNTIRCNFIGTDITGTLARPNGVGSTAHLRSGVAITGIWGGQTYDNSIEGNLISANVVDGIRVIGTAGGGGDAYRNHILHNYIGTDITGVNALGNGWDGVHLGEATHENLVEFNVICASGYNGVSIHGIAGVSPVLWATRNQIKDCLIGVNVNYDPLPNGSNGVIVGGAWWDLLGWADSINTIGPHNVIAYNVENGVAVWEESSTNNNNDMCWITRNSIYENGGLGIDLGVNGVTFNDYSPDDADTGPNEEINFPTITIANVNPLAAVFAGTVSINSPPQDATVEVFLSDLDPSGYGEGQVYLGSTQPDPLGNWILTVPTSTPEYTLGSGDYVVATTTDAAFNTSEFSEQTPLSTVPITCRDESPMPGKAYGGTETEPNDQCTTADDAYCEECYSGELEAPADVDWWTITMDPNLCGYMCLHLRVFADDTPGQEAYGDGLDPKVTIYRGICGALTQAWYEYDNNGIFPQTVGHDCQYDCYDNGNCHQANAPLFIKIEAENGTAGKYLLVVNCYDCTPSSPEDWDDDVKDEGDYTKSAREPSPAAYLYEVTPDQHTTRSGFHVRVYDSTAENYYNWVEPSGWLHEVHKEDDEWWVSWWSPDCSDPITEAADFGFENESRRVWSTWTTTLFGEAGPDDNVADVAHDHTDLDEGAGYLISVPMPGNCPDDLITWWPLDEDASLTVADDIVGGFTGERLGGILPAAGLVRGASSFDGIDDYIEIPDSDTLDFGAADEPDAGDFSIEGWIRTSASIGVVMILDKRDESSSVQGYGLFLVDGVLWVQLADGVGSSVCSLDPNASSCTNYSSGTFVADDYWRHIAVTVDRDAVDGGRFYVDGQVVATFDPTLRDGPLSNERPLRIGSRSSQVTGLFEGLIDELSLHGTALSSRAVERIFQAGSAGKCPGDCCQGRVGDANGSCTDEPTIGDISVMIDARFISGTCDGLITCFEEADVNQSAVGEATCNDMTIGDISFLIDYLFISGPENKVLPDCP